MERRRIYSKNLNMLLVCDGPKVKNIDQTPTGLDEFKVKHTRNLSEGTLKQWKRATRKESEVVRYVRG